MIEIILQIRPATSGAEMSPCSVKMHCYFCYKAIPHQWI